MEENWGPHPICNCSGVLTILQTGKKSRAPSSSLHLGLSLSVFVLIAVEIALHSVVREACRCSTITTRIAMAGSRRVVLPVLLQR